MFVSHLIIGCLKKYYIKRQKVDPVADGACEVCEVTKLSDEPRSWFIDNTVQTGMCNICLSYEWGGGGCVGGVGGGFMHKLINLSGMLQLSSIWENYFSSGIWKSRLHCIIVSLTSQMVACLCVLL